MGYIPDFIPGRIIPSDIKLIVFTIYFNHIPRMVFDIACHNIALNSQLVHQILKSKRISLTDGDMIHKHPIRRVGFFGNIGYSACKPLFVVLAIQRNIIMYCDYLLQIRHAAFDNRPCILHPFKKCVLIIICKIFGLNHRNNLCLFIITNTISRLNIIKLWMIIDHCIINHQKHFIIYAIIQKLIRFNIYTFRLLNKSLVDYLRKLIQVPFCCQADSVF